MLFIYLYLCLVHHPLLAAALMEDKKHAKPSTMELQKVHKYHKKFSTDSKMR